MIGVDSNVLIYGLCRSEDSRHGKAAEILAVLLQRRQLFLPLQVLGESFHVLVRKARFEPSAAAGMVGTYAHFAQLEPYGHDDVIAAMDAVARHRLSFWDALIWAVCDRVGVDLLLSEDLQHGRMLGRVTFLSPFSPEAADRVGI